MNDDDILMSFETGPRWLRLARRVRRRLRPLRLAWLRWSSRWHLFWDTW